MNLFLPLIVLNLLIFKLLLRTVISAPLNSTEPVHQLYKRTVDIIDCPPDGIMSDVIEAAVEEAITMLRSADWRLFVLYRYLRRPVVPALTNDTSVSLELASTFRTYASLIDPFMAVDGPLDSTERKATIGRVKEVRDRASVMWNNLAKAMRLRNPKLQLSCGDEWLWRQDPHGNLRADHLWDARRGLSPNIGDRWIRDTHLNPDDYAMTRYNYAAPYTTIVTINTASRFALKWVQMYDQGYSEANPNLKPFYLMRTEDYDGVDLHLKDMDKEHLTAILIHELSHANTITTNTFATDDVDCPGVRSPYGWVNCYTLAQMEPDLAKKNADSFMFLVIALYLNKYDWSTGFNRYLHWARTS